MKIKEIMSKAVVVDKDISVKEAAKIMSEKDIGSLIAIKGDKIMGIITEKDVMKSTARSANDRKISSVMSAEVYTISEDANIEEAAELMSERKVKHLPVLDEDEKLIGIITSTDLIKHSDELDDEFFLE
jgi:CBS domain-containing protein